jgi:YbbR domain-containing protein
VTRLRDALLGNWPLKVAAVGLASVLYAGIAFSENVRTWDAPVPIEVLRAPTDGSLLELPGSVSQIRYQAPLEVSARLTSGSFSASIDLSRVQPRIGADPVEVPVEVVALDPRVRVVEAEPRSVNVRLDKVVTRGLPVTIQHDQVPEGLELGPLRVEPDRVAVRGASSRLGGVRSVVGRMTLDASGIDIDQEVSLEALDESGAPIPGVEVEPATVRVQAEVARQLAYATVPVIPDLVGAPARGVRIDRVSVRPATVTIGGEGSVVAAIDGVRSEAIDIGGLEEGLDASVGLAVPAGVTVSGEPAVRVRIEVVPEQGSRVLEVGTALTGARADRTYQLAVPSVRVVVAGPQTLLDGLAVGELIAEVPVADLDIGSHDVMPVVRVPDGLAVAGLIPERVGVTVAPVAGVDSGGPTPSRSLVLLEVARA